MVPQHQLIHNLSTPLVQNQVSSFSPITLDSIYLYLELTANERVRHELMFQGGSCLNCQPPGLQNQAQIVEQISAMSVHRKFVGVS
jgi:hypothetical protein